MSKKDRRKTGHRLLFLGVLVLSLTACAGGIAYAVCCGTAADGQRGGAIGVALSFMALFVARPVPAAVLEQEDMRSENPNQQVKRINLLRTALSAMLDIQRQEMGYLTASSVISTLIWGFGDLVAAALGASA